MLNQLQAFCSTNPGLNPQVSWTFVLSVVVNLQAFVRVAAQCPILNQKAASQKLSLLLADEK